MESQTPPQLHFVVFPLMSPGHMLPMMDIATILAQHNMIVTVITTPHNASRVSQTFNHASLSGLQLRLVQLHFPSHDAGFPQGCENFDMLPSMGMGLSFFQAANTILHEPAERVFEGLTPKPNCIISDVGFPYTAHLATKFNVPRVSFYGTSCFCLLWQMNITKAMTPGQMNENWNDFVGKMAAADVVSYGLVVNSFEELELAYATDLKKAKNDKLWCVGPVSLRNKGHSDKVLRGNKASIDEDHCMKWLDMQKASDVIYVCLGSICNLTPLQFIELGMALEESKKPFIWVIRERNQSEELNKWTKESGYLGRWETNSFEHRITVCISFSCARTLLHACIRLVGNLIVTM
ncbi:hypothetical protein RIF29_39869 [Crotalaria pallida]|uniref:Uncharacterized protein n=1 Tax=Crotalaria pallida TaxID=3830 RepID=A0AAN9HQ01_CROPI